MATLLVHKLISQDLLILLAVNPGEGGGQLKGLSQKPRAVNSHIFKPPKYTDCFSLENIFSNVLINENGQRIKRSSS